jgi:hypothetical protein
VRNEENGYTNVTKKLSNAHKNPSKKKSGKKSEKF